MKHVCWLFCGLLAAGHLFAGVPSMGEANAGFEKLKTLEGIWTGIDTDGRSIRISYKTVSAGTAVMETIDHDKLESVMVTMYHLDNDKLIMTHYCSMGNQPRMRLSEIHPTTVSFVMFDASNHSRKDDPIMNRLVITWTDQDHITEEWTAEVKGKDSPPHAFTLERQH